MKHAEVCAVCTSTDAVMEEEISVNTNDGIIVGGKTCLSVKELSKAV